MAATENDSCINMTKPKNKTETNEIPSMKPWCFRVTRTGAKKYGARENWPRDMRDARTTKRKAKRNARRNPTEEELWLRVESKMGGVEARIARIKLNALRQKKHISAEELRRELVTRIERLRESRGLGSKDEALAQSQTQTKAETTPSTTTSRAAKFV